MRGNSNSNATGSIEGLHEKVVNRDENIEAFDRLPRPIRDALNYADFEYSVIDVAQALREYFFGGVAEILSDLKVNERENQKLVPYHNPHWGGRHRYTELSRVRRGARPRTVRTVGFNRRNKMRIE